LWRGAHPNNPKKKRTSNFHGRARSDYRKRQEVGGRKVELVDSSVTTKGEGKKRKGSGVGCNKAKLAR